VQPLHAQEGCHAPQNKIASQTARNRSSLSSLSDRLKESPTALTEQPVERIYPQHWPALLTVQALSGRDPLRRKFRLYSGRVGADPRANIEVRRNVVRSATGTDGCNYFDEMLVLLLTQMAKYVYLRAWSPPRSPRQINVSWPA